MKLGDLVADTDAQLQNALCLATTIIGRMRAIHCLW